MNNHTKFPFFEGNHSIQDQLVKPIVSEQFNHCSPNYLLLKHPAHLSQSQEVNKTTSDLLIDINLRHSRFNKAAIANLSEFDQSLFQSFSQGPIVKLPFNHLHTAFEYWEKLQPDAIAAQFENKSISYKQLNSQANSLALKLLKLGIDSGSNVGVFVKRSINMLVAMLAVLKTGAAYVPLDIGVSPKQQIDKIIESAGIKIVLSLEPFSHKCPNKPDLQVIDLDKAVNTSSKTGTLTKNLNTQFSRQSCAFVLFTSGTTGIPNGVRVSHNNLCNILLTYPGNLNIQPGTKVGQILNIAFDMSAWEIWGALCNGACLLIRSSCITETAAQADILIATPSILNKIPLTKTKPFQAVAVAGEPCPRSLADSWSDHCAFYNSCGPTETTIINTAKRHFSENTTLSIGSPTPNNTVYILDAKLKPCPIGEVGEMWAGGEGITLGYINNAQLTDERYLQDPFLEGNKRMFRTRDLGRWTKDGLLEHLGRTDDQVKIRGFRVELDAISNYLEQQPNWNRAVTLKLNDRDLISFVMPLTDDHQQLTLQAQQLISEHLPYYCLPKHIIGLEELPLTDRGKVDKKQLRARFFEQYNQNKSEKNIEEQANA
jgi:amino acid adenylation domain-containing protein